MLCVSVTGAAATDFTDDGDDDVDGVENNSDSLK